MMFIPSVDQIDQTAREFDGKIRNTPLFRSIQLEQKLNSDHPIYFKAENLQHTGSFKVRGALSKLLSILPDAKKRGVIAASAGNHAQGVAFFAEQLGVAACIVMPENSPLVKVRAT